MRVADNPSVAVELEMVAAGEPFVILLVVFVDFDVVGVTKAPSEDTIGGTPAAVAGGVGRGVDTLDFSESE